MKSFTHLLFGLALIGVVSCQEVRSVKVKVIEEDGTSVEGAKVTVTFLGSNAEQTIRKIGESDGKGAFSAKGTPPLRMSARIEKAGYYATFSGRLSRKKDHDLTLVLRKHKNPIELFAKKFRGKVPGVGKRHGFDFEIGDWVTPHGKGQADRYIF